MLKLVILCFALFYNTVSSTRFLFGVEVKCDFDEVFQLTVSHWEDDGNTFWDRDEDITGRMTMFARKKIFFYQDGHHGFEFGKLEPYGWFLHNCTKNGNFREYRHGLSSTSGSNGLEYIEYTMSEFLKIVRANKKSDRKLDKTYLWESYLHQFEKGKTSFIPVEAFNRNLTVNFNECVKEGVIFETVVHDYDKNCDSIQVRWFARIEKVCGYRVLAQFIGADTKFWLNILSDDMFGLANAAMSDPNMDKIVYAPPLAINEEYQNDMVNYVNNCIDGEIVGQTSLSPKFDEGKALLSKHRFKVGQRLELLNYSNSTEIRVARIQEICGRRMNVSITKKDFPESLPDADDDRQVFSSGSQYWIDEGSFFIFPVGFAAVNGYQLNAKKEYIEHTNKIAQAIKNGENPRYDSDDVTFDQLAKDPIDPMIWRKVKVGQKFELIDPLAQQFNNLHVASILKFCKTEGYLIVGMDGPDALEDSFPIHINNTFMFPVGYAEKYNLELVPPDEFKGTFRWDEYLEKESAETLPLDLFKPMPSQERLDKFKVGLRLEAADMCENQFICPATVKSVHGRLINVNFDGWDEEFDELYDVDSHDILPIGWCEAHSYVLQPPKKYNY